MLFVLVLIRGCFLVPILRLCSFYPVPNYKLGGRLASILRVSQ